MSVKKTNPLKEVNQAVLTSCRSESSSFKFAIYCYSVKYLYDPPPFPAAFTAPVHKSCAWVLWLLNKVLLGWPGVTQWPLGLLRSTHVYSEEKELRYSMQPGGSEPSLMPNQTYRLFQPRINYGVTCYEFDPTYKVRWTETCIWEESNICFESRQTYFLSFLWVRLRLTQRWVD